MSDTALFTPADADQWTKVRCTVCGRSGYPSEGPTGWQKDCRAGHPFKCTCGRLFSTKQGLAGHLRQMIRAAKQAQASGMDWPPVSNHQQKEEGNEWQ